MPRSRSNTRHNHLHLARQIIEHVAENRLSPGHHLPELHLAQICNVSRTPIRSALKILESRGLVSQRTEGGFFVDASVEQISGIGLASLDDLEETLATRILNDRAERRITDIVSVSGLVRRYDAGRSTVLNALKILSADGIVLQMPGRSWAFQPILDTANAVHDSLEFRLNLEPQAITSSGFRMDTQKAARVRQEMEAFLKVDDGNLSAASFLRADCAFHSLIAESSGNRFIKGTLLAHHRLRLNTQKDYAIPDFRLKQSIEEHLDIFDSLERDQYQLAADQMVLHLRQNQVRRHRAANRGVVPFGRGKSA
ncbi:MAG: GntR family transcriptional regulator [Pseudomonadota bacterium]